MRGACRRCPRCGTGHLFEHWFALRDRCPGCGYLFNREEGFFLGAFVINFGVTIFGLALIMAVLIGVLAANGSHQALVWVVVAAIVEAVVVPLLFYPTSKTLWCAIDLVMHRSEGWSRLPPSPEGKASRRQD